MANKIIGFFLDKQYELNSTIIKVLLNVKISQVQGLGAILVSQAWGRIL